MFDGEYSKVYREIMALPGVVAVGLLQGIATVVAIVEGPKVTLFHKEELIEAIKAAAERETIEGGSSAD